MTHMNDTEPCCPPACCDMRGMLSFMILWIVSKGERYGQEVAKELSKRRGGKPNPGTLYPALKELEAKGMVVSRSLGRKRYYCLTDEGRKELETACRYFCQAFGEIVRETSP